MSITVLIATYNRAEMLDRCLRQLARQSFEPGDEIVVADNGSTDGTDVVVRTAAVYTPATVRYVSEVTPGKSHALSAGLRVSQGEVIALTDDDVLVDDDWLATIRRLWRELSPGLVGGRVTPMWERPTPRWLRLPPSGGYGPLSAPLALLDYGPVPSALGERTALGANMVVARQALIAAGGFPLDLGKLRGTLLSGEDHQICERVQAAGFTALYDPRLVVRHHVPAERLRLSYHLRWFFWSGITNAALDRDERRQPVSLRHWAGRIARGCGRAALGAVSTRFGLAAEGLMDIAFALGYVGYVRGWVHNRSSVDRQPPEHLEAA